ncbi:hypothetical protein BAY59_29300 [Prauserella coralliicola]|nr:hypothetical protein BAY59_29300 [Prauserella coralliicola]
MTTTTRRPVPATARRRTWPALGTLGLASSGIVTLVAAWWIAADVFDLSENGVLASPLAVLERLVTLTYDPLAGLTLPGHALASFERWGAGFAVAAALGLLLGFAFAWWPGFRSALLPAFEVLRYIPPFAWIPLAILWFGPGFTAQAFVVFIAVLPPCVLNAELGVRSVDDYVVKASRVLGASRMSTLVTTVVPASLPTALTGLRIGVGNGWMALMGAELIVGRSGLGYVILSGQQSNDPATVLAGMVAIGVLGALMDRGVRFMANPFIRWRKGVETGAA